VNSLLRLCGSNLSKQETYLLMKKSDSQGDRVQYRKMSLAVENIMNDVKVDPYLMVLHMMLMFFNN